MYLGNTGDKMKQMNLIQKWQNIVGLQGQYERALWEYASMENTCLRSEQQKHKYNHMGWNAALWKVFFNIYIQIKKPPHLGKGFFVKVFVQPEMSSSILPCMCTKCSRWWEGKSRRAVRITRVEGKQRVWGQPWDQASASCSQVWASETWDLSIKATSWSTYIYIFFFFWGGGAAGGLMRSICCSGSATSSAPRQPHSPEGLHLR